MQVTVEDVSAVEKRLAIEVPWEEVKSKMDEAYRELGKEVALKGFRKGKAPRGLLEQLFGKRIERELARQIVEETFPRAASEKGLHPVADPVVEDDGVKTGSPFCYRARVEVAPEVVAKDYFGIPLVRRVRQVTDEMVDGEVERKRAELTEFRKIEDRQELRAGDIALCDVMGKLGDKPFASDRQLVEIGSSAKPSFPWPRIAADLVGAGLSGEKEVSFTIGDDHPDEALRGKAAKLLVTVRDAREKLAPELDDEFAKDTGEADTLEELRKILRDRIAAALKIEAEREMHNALRAELIKRNPVEISPTLVDRHLTDLVNRTKEHISADGTDLEAENVNDEKLREHLRPTAEDSVRAALLMEAIARTENVEVLDADLEKRIAEMASARRTNPTRLRAELDKENRLPSLRQLLREEKTLDLLLSKATITEESDENASR